MSSEWKYRCHIRDPYFVSCTFYTCWRSLYSPFLNSFDLLVIIEGILKAPIIFLLSSSHSSEVSVLVPGAGLGRLAYEIASRGFTCQGNEFSMHMLFGSNFILNRYVHVMPMTLPLHTYMCLYTCGSYAHWNIHT